MKTRNLIPVSRWGRGHWSLFLKLEPRFAKGENKVEFVLEWRQNAKNFEMLASRMRNCRKIVRAKIMKPEMGTILKGKVTETGHDDWNCIEDMIGAGLLYHGDNTGKLIPGKSMKFTPLGLKTLERLKAHKADRGQFDDFDPKIG